MSPLFKKKLHIVYMCVFDRRLPKNIFKFLLHMTFFQFLYDVKIWCYISYVREKF